MSNSPASPVSVPFAVPSPGFTRACFGASLLSGLGIALWLMHASTGAALDDEIGHYLLSRDVWSRPELAFSQWGRTLNTLIYAVPALLGLEGARCFSLAMTLGATFLTWRLAQAFDVRHAALAPLFFWFQPWIPQNAWACLTEVPFLLFLLGGVYALVRERPLLAGFLLGCLPLFRHEGLGIVAAACAYAGTMRNGRLLIALLTPYLVYAVSYRLGQQDWPFSLFTNAKPTDAYGSGGWLHFAPALISSVGPAIAIAPFGLPQLVRTPRGMLIGALYLLYLMMHVVIYRFGLYASGGYVEFLLPLAPTFAVAAAAGVDLLAKGLAAWNRSWTWAPTMAMGMLGVVCVADTVLRSHPFELKPVQAASVEAAGWIRAHGLQDRRIEATDVWLYYSLPLPFPEPTKLVLHSTPLDELPSGTLVVWDSKYSNGWGRPLGAMADKPRQWRRLQVFGPHEEVILFEKV